MKVQTVVRSSVKSRFGIVGFCTTDGILGLWFLFNRERPGIGIGERSLCTSQPEVKAGPAGFCRGRLAFHPINMQGKLMTQPDARQIPGMKPSTDAALDLR